MSKFQVLTGVTLFLGLEVSLLLLQTYLMSLRPNSSVFVLSDHKRFLQKVFGLFMWATVSVTKV